MNVLIYLPISLTFLPLQSGQSPVPIEKEPRHRLKFENQYVRVFDVPERPQACTVTELTPSNEENFLSADDCSSTRAATSASMHNPSERLVPSALA